MTKKKPGKIESFKATIEKRDSGTAKESRALTLHNRLLEIKKNFIGNAFAFYTTMLAVEKEESWKEMGYTSFESYICLPEIDCGVEPETVKKYIRKIKRCFEIGLEAEEISGVPINKLSMVIGTKKPMYWLEEAKLLGINDLRDKIAVEDRGEAEPEPKVKKNKTMVCPACGAVINL